VVLRYLRPFTHDFVVGYYSPTPLGSIYDSQEINFNINPELVEGLNTLLTRGATPGPYPLPLPTPSCRGVEQCSILSINIFSSTLPFSQGCDVKYILSPGFHPGLLKGQPLDELGVVKKGKAHILLLNPFRVLLATDSITTNQKSLTYKKRIP